MELTIIAIITSISMQQGIDPALVQAVVKTESNFNIGAIGSVGEIGLMQIRGEYSTIERQYLFIPQVNVYEGIRKLKFAKKHCSHKENMTWLVCYNAGVTKGSKYENPEKNEYYQTVMKNYESYKYVTN